MYIYISYSCVYRCVSYFPKTFFTQEFQNQTVAGHVIPKYVSLSKAKIKFI